MYSIEEIGIITRAIRAATRKFRIKTYLLNCVYFSYLYNGKDSTRYINRFVLGFSVSPVSIYNNTALLIKYELIKKVTTNTFLLSNQSIDICLFVDKQSQAIKNS